MKRNLTATESGIAGEYFVAAELSRRGFIATLTIKNTKGTDILASLHTGNAIRIQVKTRYNARKKWLLSKTDQEIVDPSSFYVFVDLNKGGHPSYHIVPSAVVARQIAAYHVEYLSQRKKDGGERKDVDMRTFVDRNDEFKDKWELLGLPEC